MFFSSSKKHNERLTKSYEDIKKCTENVNNLMGNLEECEPHSEDNSSKKDISPKKEDNNDNPGSVFQQSQILMTGD